MYSNLKIFKGTEYNLNAKLTIDGVWEAYVYLDEVSTGLYESTNIFILEEVLSNGDIYLNKPISESVNPTQFQFMWNENVYESEDFIMYGVKLENGITKIDVKKTQNISILDSSYATGLTNGINEVTTVDNEAIQINIALGSIVEGRHQRTLLVYANDGVDKILVARIIFYGEVVGEDERLRVLLQNFGASLEDSDFMLFKEHDITEMAPDYILLNQKRRELLLELSNIKPFVGTYKAILNAIDFFGYDDITLKEYWLNINTGSSAFGKLHAVPVPNSSKYGEAVRKAMTIKVPNSNLKKTSRFSLVYKINVPDGGVDIWDIPTVEEIFAFTPEEVLIKLYGLKNKLQKEYLPLNSRIVDITGEGDFFAQKNLNVWNNQNAIGFISEGINIKYEYFPANRPLFIEDVALVLNKVYDVNDIVGTGRDDYNAILNTEFSDYDTLTSAQLGDLRQAITEFHTTYYDQPLDTFNYNIDRSTKVPVGCPVILDGEKTFDTSWDSAEFTWEDAVDPNALLKITWDAWWKRWVYEIEWIIKTDNLEYSFKGPIDDYLKFPIFLPYDGIYSVEMRTYDLFGHRSYDYKSDMINVNLKEVELYGFYKRLGKNTWNDRTDINWKQAGGYWDLPIQNREPLNELNASWYLGLNRANYIHDITSDEDINYATVSRYLDVFSETGYSETSGPYTWANSDFEWKWTSDLWWNATRIGADLAASFIIQEIENGSTLTINHINPTNNNLQVGTITITANTPTSSTDIVGWQAVVDELNSSVDPIISKFIYNLVIKELNTYPADNVFYILAVGKRDSRSFDFDSVSIDIGLIDGESHHVAYNPTFDDTEIFTDWRNINRSTHVTFCAEYSKMPGMKLKRWTINNNTYPEKSDIYYGDIVLTYLFKYPGDYTISLEVEDTNGNTNITTRNMLKVN